MSDYGIQWYPGHMTKTRRQMEQDLRQVDAVCELVDARIPRASRNPDIDAIFGAKPRLLILNRTDMADPGATKRWAEYFRKQGLGVVQTDCKSRRGLNAFAPAVRSLLADKIAAWRQKGQVGRSIRLMIVGVPNVGKSTFINQIAGRRSAKAENRPGVTRGRQWVAAGKDLLLLDTPGILWPKFDDPEVGLLLAYTGAVRDEILDIQMLACSLIERLWARYPDALRERYRLDGPADAMGVDLLTAAGRARGFLLRGGEIDTERMARVLLEEFRSSKLGRFTLEEPEAERNETTDALGL